jgi:hypothetical protein
LPPKKSGGCIRIFFPVEKKYRELKLADFNEDDDVAYLLR